jgi:hypothetical protein
VSDTVEDIFGVSFAVERVSTSTRSVHLLGRSLAFARGVWGHVPPGKLEKMLILMSSGGFWELKWICSYSISIEA